MKSMYNFCAPYIKKYKCLIALYYLIIVLCGVISVFVPVLNGKIVDYISKNQHKYLFLHIIFFFVANIFIIILSLITNQLYIKIQTNIAYDIISTLIYHMQYLPLKIIDKLDTGSLNQKINNDSNCITSFIIDIIGKPLINLISLLFSCCILIHMNYIMGLIMLSIGFIYILMYIILRNIMYNKSFKLMEEQAKFFSAMLIQLKNIKFVKIHSLITEYHQKMNKSYSNYYNNVIKSESFFFLYSSLDEIITIIANMIIFIIGGNMVMEHKITIGEFTIILYYFNYIISAFKYFSSLAKQYQETKVSFGRLQDLFNLKKQSDGKHVISKISNISCIDLSIHRNGKRLFSNFNYTFYPGKIYCICGENGTGKTTFLETMIGIHGDEYTGQILYNNLDIRKINMLKLRYSNISFMEQNLTLLEGDAIDSILLSHNHSLHNISNSLGIDISQIKKYTNSLGKIHSNGSGISGGESEKIGLYRLLSKFSDLYILDEPTASLDQNNIKEFMEYLYQIKDDKIIIIVSHNPSTIKMCDCIINL